MTMQTMTIKGVEERISQRGNQFWNVQLGTPDGSTLLATIWEPEVREALGSLKRADVEIERNAKGYAKITAVQPRLEPGPSPLGTGVGSNPATGYRYLALDAVSKLFQGCAPSAGDLLEYARSVVAWLESGSYDIAEEDYEPPF